MYTQPLVSVLIPLYNKAAYFAETIESVLNQTYPNIEVIIVDDGSTDGSLDIAQGYASERVFVIKQTNKGASAARNTAFEYAKGDFIQYLDADDILDVRKIEQQINILRGQNDVLATAKCIDFIVQKDKSWQTFSRAQLCKNYDNTTLFLLEEVKQAALVHSWLIPRNLIEKAGKWDEAMTIFDDRDFYLRLVPLASKIIYCENAICYYRLPNSEEHLSYKNGLTDLEASLHYFSEFESQLLLSKSPYYEDTKTILACLYKKLLIISLAQKTIIDELLCRCLKWRIVPNCHKNWIVPMIVRLVGIKICFQMIVFQMIWFGKKR